MIERISLISYSTLFLFISVQSSPLFTAKTEAKPNVTALETQFKEYLEQNDNYLELNVLESICTSSLLKSAKFGESSTGAVSLEENILTAYPIELVSSGKETKADLVYCRVRRSLADQDNAKNSSEHNSATEESVEFYISKGWFLFVDSEMELGQQSKPAHLIENLEDSGTVDVDLRASQSVSELEAEFQESYLNDDTSEGGGNVKWNVLRDICQSAMRESIIFGRVCKETFALYDELVKRYPIKLQTANKKGHADLLLCEVKCVFTDAYRKKKNKNSDISKGKRKFLLSKGWFIFVNKEGDYKEPRKPVQIVERL